MALITLVVTFVCPHCERELQADIAPFIAQVPSSPKAQNYTIFGGCMYCNKPVNVIVPIQMAREMQGELMLKQAALN